MFGQLSTITDPGNAATAITVGSVHRYRPHTYGITFNSSKGPTLDGRMKPDLVAPGERITSAATGQLAGRAALGARRRRDRVDGWPATSKTAEPRWPPHMCPG